VVLGAARQPSNPLGSRRPLRGVEKRPLRECAVDAAAAVVICRLFSIVRVQGLYWL